jgi:hypothetical protein
LGGQPGANAQDFTVVDPVTQILPRLGRPTGCFFSSVFSHYDGAKCFRGNISRNYLNFVQLQSRDWSNDFLNGENRPVDAGLEDLLPKEVARAFQITLYRSEVQRRSIEPLHFARDGSRQILRILETVTIRQAHSVRIQLKAFHKMLS